MTGWLCPRRGYGKLGRGCGRVEGTGRAQDGTVLVMLPSIIINQAESLENSVENIVKSDFRMKVRY